MTDTNVAGTERLKGRVGGAEVRKGKGKLLMQATVRTLALILRVGKPLDGFRQKSDVIWLVFSKAHSCCYVQNRL